MSYAEGFNSGTAAGRAAVASWESRAEKERQKVLDQQRAELHDMQMQGLKRQRGLERDQDAAFGAHTDLANNGYVQAEGTGLSQPSAQFVASGNAGLGVGAQAVQDTASMYQREMSRFAGAANPPAQGLPKYDGTAPVTRRDASDVELEQSLGRVSAAQRDARGMRESNESVKKLKLRDEDAAFMKQAMADLRDPAGFIEKYGAGMNKNGNVDGFVTFDPKTKQFVAASKAGVESLDEVDMLAHVMAARELGRGNVQVGLELMAKSSDRADAKFDKKYNRAMELAKGNMEAYFGGRRADNDDKRTAAYGASVGAAEKRAAAAHREVPPALLKQMNELAVKLGDPGLTPAERTATSSQLRALQGEAATHLGRTLGMPVAPNRDEDLKTAADLVKAGAYKTLPEAMDAINATRGADPLTEMTENLRKIEAERLTAEEKRRAAGGGSGLRPPPAQTLPPEQRPAARGVSNYGKLTPWPTIEEGIRAGDPAAIDYASQYLGGPYGGFGGTMPDSTRRLLEQTITQP